MTPAIDIQHVLRIGFGQNLWQSAARRHRELEVKVVRNLRLARGGVYGLGEHFDHHVSVVGAHDLRVEEEERADEDWLLEGDVVDGDAAWRCLAVQARVRPRYLVGLTHEEAWHERECTTRIRARLERRCLVLRVDDTVFGNKGEKKGKPEE